MKRVKNYYELTPSQLEASLRTLRDWLFWYPNHEKAMLGSFALDVALCAKALVPDEDTKAISQWLIEYAPVDKTHIKEDTTPQVSDV